MATGMLFALTLAAAAWGQAAGDCTKPPGLENGSLDDKYISMHPFKSGDKVYYKCYPGYVFAEGSRRYITCEGDAWGQLQATCNPKSCGSPGEIMNGHYDDGNNTFGSKVKFHCDRGYELVGRGYRLCTVDGWDGKVPICEAVKCPDIPSIANGKASSPSGEFWEFGMVVTFSCLGDYSLIGASTLRCLDTGTWSDNYPVCKDVKCLKPMDLENIRIVSGFGPVYKYQETIVFRCKTGYEMVGESTITCGENNQFSPEPPTCRLRPKVTTTTAGPKVTSTTAGPKVSTTASSAIVPTTVAAESGKGKILLIALPVAIGILFVVGSVGTGVFFWYKKSKRQKNIKRKDEGNGQMVASQLQPLTA